MTITVGDESTPSRARGKSAGVGFGSRSNARLVCLRGFVEDGGPPSFRLTNAQHYHPVSAAPERACSWSMTTARANHRDTMLKASGMSALQPARPKKLELPERDSVDLIVLDWSLPGMTGIDLCKRLRADCRLAPVPVLFLTAHSSSEDLVAAFEAGADDFVSKPFRAPELKARVLGLLRRTQPLYLAVH